MSQASNLAEMPFLEHLAELRGRLLKAFAGIFAASIVSFIWSSSLFSFLTAPLLKSAEGASLIGTGPTEAFMAKIHVSLAFGFLLSLPYSFYQLWCFISPGLHPQERRFAVPFVVLTSLFFLAGVSFCFAVVLPVAFGFLIGEFSTINAAANIRIGDYLSFVVRLLLVFGIVFELPVICYLLARLGLITHQMLTEKFRYAVIVVFIAAGVLTPSPDVASQLLLVAPMLVLYGLCIAVAYLAAPRAPANPNPDTAG